MLESEVAGFGASGRNGGWCSALFPTDVGPEQDAAMRDTVDEVLRAADAEGIDCHAAKGGTITLVRSPPSSPASRASHDGC